MNALVTGATGFVGRHLVDALVQAGDTVTALVRSPEKGKLLGRSGVRLAPGHLGSMEALRSAVHGQDVDLPRAGWWRRATRRDSSRSTGTDPAAARGRGRAGRPASYWCPRWRRRTGAPGTQRRSGDEEAARSRLRRSKLAGERALRRAGCPG